MEPSFQNLFRKHKIICKDCNQRKTSKDGRSVEFFNTEWLGAGCQSYYIDVEPREKYDSQLCYIDGNEFFAAEAKFGGIVIQKKPATE